MVKKPRGGEGEGDHVYSIGFVNMMSHEEAELIIQKLNKYSIEVRNRLIGYLIDVKLIH